MTAITLIKHAKGAPGLRFLGLGPQLRPTQGLKKLQILLKKNAFWAKYRSKKQLKCMLANSTEIVSLWQKKDLIGFGRATSDKVYRAVFWDLVVSGDLQGNGLGRMIVEALLEAPSIKRVEKIYLMTTNSSEFYQQLGFKMISKQKLLLKD